jgi:hypothetical protein
VRGIRKSSTPQPRGQLPPIETVGLIHPLVGAFVGLGVEEALPFIAHQGFQKLSVMFFHLRIEVFKKELAGLLQSPPTGGRLNDERCRGAHGCIVLSRFGVYVHLIQPRYTRSSAFTQQLLRYRFTWDRDRSLTNGLN